MNGALKLFAIVAMGFAALAALALGLRIFSIWGLGSPSATAAWGAVLTSAVLGLLLTLSPILVPLAIAASVAGPAVEGWFKLIAALVYGTVLSALLLTAVPEEPTVRPGILVGLCLVSTLSSALLFCIPVAKWFPVLVLIPIVIWRFWFPATLTRVVNPPPVQPQRVYVSHGQCETIRWFETAPQGAQPRYWHSRGEDGNVRLFQAPGWDPKTTEPLLPVTPQIVRQYCQQTAMAELRTARQAEAARRAGAEKQAEAAHQADLEAERARLAAQWQAFQQAQLEVERRDRELARQAVEGARREAEERRTSQPRRATSPSVWYSAEPSDHPSIVVPRRPAVPEPPPQAIWIPAPRVRHNPVLDLNAATDRALWNALGVARTGPALVDQMVSRRRTQPPVPPGYAAPRQHRGRARPRR